MTDNIIIPFISICAEARPTRRRNGVTFQQYVLGACCACPVRVLERMLDSAGEHVRNNGVEAVDAPTQVDAGCGPSRHMAGAMARWPPVGHDEPHAG